ncbi:MAG: PP2C family serine/threonine-protein phosphatase [Candidatus Portnoybacteria bacterium]|nr:PP2C family serine/threonine-protein phosphatase [Candidatus Portnoybacteria bacterium]MDD4983043.1 PP2C family serine/threonine-protein phosphatase [Candidatus Portnoybacteria bacterium]
MVKIEEILIKAPRSKNTICDIFMYEPGNIEEASLGSLYMVAELTTDEDSLHLVNLLSSIIKREYYLLPHRGSVESLEAALKKANQALSEIANQGNLNWLGKIHFVCAALNKEKDLFLTQTGSAQAWLCRAGQLVNITKKLVPSANKPHPAKTFQSVISGTLGSGDKIIFGTPAIFDFFSLPGLKQIFSLPKIALVSEQIQKILREEKKPPTLGALLLEIAADEELLEPAKGPKKFITPPIALSELLN